MQIGEYQQMIVRTLFRLVGKFLPACVYRDAGILEAPKHGDGIADIEIILRLVGADLRVIEAEHFVILRQFEMIERAVPPDMVGEVVAAAPAVFGAFQPGNAVAGPAFHFMHMGDGMDGPNIARIGRHRALSHRPRGGVIAAFLEAEGIHAVHEAGARLARFPSRHHARQRIAHGDAVAGIEMAEMGQTQRQDIAWIIYQYAFPAGRAFDHVAGAPGVERRKMLAFARAYHLRQLARFVGGLQRFLLQRRHGEQLEEIAADAMAHEEAGIGRQGLLKMAARIGAKAEISAHCLVIMIHGLAACRRHGQAKTTVLHH